MQFILHTNQKMTFSSKPFCGFENLPLELHQIILNVLSDFSSLRSVVLASRRAHAAYNLSAEPIMRKLLRRSLSDTPELLMESQRLYSTYRLRKIATDCQDNMDDFLAYSGTDIKRQDYWNPVETVMTEGLRFHLVIENITASFLKNAIQSCQNRGSAPPKGIFCNLPLQVTERTRIQRALYRFQKMCEVHRTVPVFQPGEPTWGRVRIQDFFSELSGWEIEEICCVYRYLVLNLSFLDSPAYRAVLSKGPTEGPDSYRHREHVASMGLIFLQKLRTAPTKTCLKLLKQ